MAESLGGFRGAVVTQVTANSVAAGHVMAGDLVLAVNQTQINSANEFLVHLAAAAVVQTTSLQIYRDGKQLRVTLPPLPKDE
jgi:S1-C subfamily serine protease